ncbi:hypothetical protein WH47_09086 [Habropoda laboriosa]|uniref:Uncharacterized protein n=1 Tax=Habropoda laboriosa TaxID=597456 RepID=A0A0L7QN94_9HYME|nr:hypothetical protein WH47_09086 [Habropoda laboriosa]
MFNGRVISRGGDINWPQISCDLTPLNFFLWGFLKSKVYANNPKTIDELAPLNFFLWGFLKSKIYANNPKTIDELKNNITAAINEIEFQLCENWVKRNRLMKKKTEEDT